MAGLADIMFALSGQPDPRKQLAAMLAGQQPQGAPPQGAAPPAAQPPVAGGAAAPQPPDPNAPAPDAQPVSGQQPNPVAPGAQPPPGSPPQPMALQSTPDMAQSYNALANPPNLMSLYLQLDARNRASDQINRGLALIAANHAGNPGMARAIMDSVSGGANASGQVGDLMQLYNAQQQMAGQQQMLAQADSMDQKLGLPPGTSRAMILAGRGSELVSKLEPTDEQRNIQWKHDAFIKSGGTEEDWQRNYLPMILTGGLGAGSEDRARIFALGQWNSDAANKGRPPPAYLTDPTKWKLYQADLTDAKQQFGGLNQSLDKFIGDMGDVANNPSLDKITGSTGNILTGTFEGMVPGEVNNLKTAMTGLRDQAKDMASRGGPKGVGQNIKTLGSSPEDFTNASLTDYRDTVIAPRMRQALTAQANANGAAGQANNMPGYLNHYLDKGLYGPGGDLDIGGARKTVSPDTGPDGKALPQPTSADLDVFYRNLEHYGPKKALEQLKADNIDTSSLR